VVLLCVLLDMFKGRRMKARIAIMNHLLSRVYNIMAVGSLFV
jgi:hypothetical protein